MIPENCQKFLDSLDEICPPIKKAIENLSERWKPRTPPLTTLFEAAGDALADNFECEEIDRNTSLFDLIERAMNEDDDMLRTAVATGLVEALVSSAVRQSGQWEKMVLQLGERTREHALAWIEG